MSATVTVPGKGSRRILASVAVALLVAQSAVVGTSVWCPDETSGDHAAAVADGMTHAPATHESDSHQHHGSDAASACPMMALCTLATPSPSMGLGLLASVPADAPESVSWSVHGAVLTHTPPPPRV